METGLIHKMACCDKFDRLLPSFFNHYSMKFLHTTLVFWRTLSRKTGNRGVKIRDINV